MMELTNLIEQGTLTYLPHISVDSAIFSFHDGVLKVLVLRMKDQSLYSLPGGYVGREEDLDGAAQRIVVRGGFAEVGPAGLTVLAEQATFAAEFDAATIAQAIQDAEEDVTDAADDAARDKARERLEQLNMLKLALEH